MSGETQTLFVRSTNWLKASTNFRQIDLGDVTTVGQPKLGELTLGEMSKGQLTIGEQSLGDLTLGEVLGNPV